MGNIFCWDQDPTPIFDLKKNTITSDTGTVLPLYGKQKENSYFYALSNVNYCKMCEKPKNLTKGILFCIECKYKYGLP